MRVAIVTIQSLNYGNRLQNYALQTILQREGYKVESLLRMRLSFLVRFKHILRRIIKHDSVTMFRAFNRRCIAYSRFVACNEYVTPSLEGAYDKFIIGSDQVWNPSFPFNGSVDYLPFVAPDKKIAYAASFGVGDLGDKDEEIADYLLDIPYISMREEAGVSIVKRLTGRDARLVADPTLLLTVEDWDAVSRKPRGFNPIGPFVVRYVLGDYVDDNRIKAISDQYGADVVDILDDRLNIGPSEFVWLVANCEAMCTDSFHASVFALLYHKPLAVFGRNDDLADMSSRLDTLCELFNVWNCRVDNDRFDIDAIDWEDFESRLARFRLKSLGWLKAALDGQSV